jgi:hypothetical protein
MVKMVKSQQQTLEDHGLLAPLRLSTLSWKKIPLHPDEAPIFQP